MNDIDRNMLLILAIDDSAVVCFSAYTMKWFVQSRIEISNGSMLAGITEHRENFYDAVEAYVARMKAVGTDESIAIESCGERRYYRWNGAAFGMVMARVRTP